MIYMDSNAIMRMVCGDEASRARFAAEIGSEKLLTSTLALVECLCKPIATKDELSLTLLRGFFSSIDVLVAPTTVEIAMKAAEIRAQFKFKTPDAVHIATALSHDLSKVLTTDTDFEKARSLTSAAIVVLKP